MDETTMLTALKVDLGISTTAYDDRLLEVLQVAAQEIAREGITLGSEVISDGDLQVTYAAWLWRKRRAESNTGRLTTQETVSGMPRSLRWRMNNRLFEEKVGKSNG